MAYDPTSPWKKTGLIKNKVLDIMNNVYLEFDPLDELYTVPQNYDMRPDLCSYISLVSCRNSVVQCIVHLKDQTLDIHCS